jgi:uncharacterized protein YcsI (UPF0317 family)
METQISAASSASVRALRLRIRRGEHRSYTAGLAPGFLQGNVVILTKDLAADFLRFCHANPKPCPLLASSEPGQPNLPSLGPDLDIRTDVPMYRVWKQGELVAETPEISSYWRDDLVAFVLGCSFSFEEALLESGIELRHLSCGVNVPMYRSSIMTQPAGPFHGPMVVSMRPLSPKDAIRAIQITSRFPAAHGAPIHIGLPQLIGITALDQPHYGDAVEVGSAELPVFWACGVTPQAVIERAKLAFAITHAPGSMLITDRRNMDLAVL